MSVSGESRIEATRRRLQTVRIGIAAAAVVAFGALVGFARASHPAKATTPSSSSDGRTQSFDDRQQSDEFGFGDGSIGPSFGGGSSLQTGSS